MKLKGKKVVVTGGAGFIGSHLVDSLLDAGVENVGVVDNFFLGKDGNLAPAKKRFGDALEIFREDAADSDAMRAAFDAIRPDIVFNLATKALPYSFFNPPGACRVNLDIAIVLAEYLRLGAFHRLIHVSSSEVYGTARSVPMSESHPLLAETSYAAGKAAADLLLASYVNMFDLDIVTVRPFNNYGPRQNKGNYAAVVPLTIERIRNGEAPVIEGDGLQTRDFIYVGDTVNAIMRTAAMDDVRGEVFNLGSGKETTIKELITVICEVMGYSGEIVHAQPRKADVRRHSSDSSKLAALLGDLATTPLRRGIRKTVAWYKDAADRG